MSPATFEDRATPFAAAPRWLTPHMVVLSVLFLGTATLAFARVDAAPGAVSTAVMLLAAWSPMALPMRQRRVRSIGITWTASIVLLHLAWGGIQDWGSNENHFARLAVGGAMVGLFASFAWVWRAFHREVESPASDSAGQLAVIGGAWLAVAGCVSAVDALTRTNTALPERVRLTEGGIGTGTAGLGVLVALAAVQQLRRRARWFEGVWEGTIEGWSLAYYTPASGELATIPRLIGGVAGNNPALTCLLVRKPSVETMSHAGYRDVSARGAVVVGRLDATPPMGGLKAALRGEGSLLGLSRALALGFSVTTLVPLVIFAVLIALYLLCWVIISR